MTDLDQYKQFKSEVEKALDYMEKGKMKLETLPSPNQDCIGLLRQFHNGTGNAQCYHTDMLRDYILEAINLTLNTDILPYAKMLMKEALEFKKQKALKEVVEFIKEEKL